MHLPLHTLTFTVTGTNPGERLRRRIGSRNERPMMIGDRLWAPSTLNIYQ
jgi:hypothetical protein